jgi:hypothetical protein
VSHPNERHLQSVEPPRGGWFLSSRAEIDAFFEERSATFAAMLEAERHAHGEQEQLEFEECAA